MEKYDLRKLKETCKANGIDTKHGRNFINIKLQSVSFNLFENGNIWLCKAPCEDKALEFELIDRAFFWLNFASKSLKKVEVGK